LRHSGYAKEGKKFSIWFTDGNVDQIAAADAVRAWTAHQSATGFTIQGEMIGSTQFELRVPPPPDWDLFDWATMQIRMDHRDPSGLFLHHGVAVYPEQ
jgi:hypothetical protein